ncbi:MAG: hypothetical protein Greene041619_284 [Candidatus Peregrinibacteria bacterium Greene0416_19]|nr:MAG: hypothetical protein Greene041619_284 [Candidatus Peregrinibacteria bacterium Greene0416_19]
MTVPEHHDFAMDVSQEAASVRTTVVRLTGEYERLLLALQEMGVTGIPRKLPDRCLDVLPTTDDAVVVRWNALYGTDRSLHDAVMHATASYQSLRLASSGPDHEETDRRLAEMQAEIQRLERIRESIKRADESLHANQGRMKIIGSFLQQRRIEREALEQERKTGGAGEAVQRTEAKETLLRAVQRVHSLLHALSGSLRTLLWNPVLAGAPSPPAMTESAANGVPQTPSPSLAIIDAFFTPRRGARREIGNVRRRKLSPTIPSLTVEQEVLSQWKRDLALFATTEGLAGSLQIVTGAAGAVIGLAALRDYLIQVGSITLNDVETGDLAGICAGIRYRHLRELRPRATGYEPHALHAGASLGKGRKFYFACPPVYTEPGRMEKVAEYFQMCILAELLRKGWTDLAHLREAVALSFTADAQKEQFWTLMDFLHRNSRGSPVENIYTEGASGMSTVELREECDALAAKAERSLQAHCDDFLQFRPVLQPMTVAAGEDPAVLRQQVRTFLEWRFPLQDEVASKILGAIAERRGDNHLQHLRDTVAAMRHYAAKMFPGRNLRWIFNVLSLHRHMAARRMGTDGPIPHAMP